MPYCRRCRDIRVPSVYLWTITLWLLSRFLITDTSIAPRGYDFRGAAEHTRVNSLLELVTQWRQDGKSNLFTYLLILNRRTMRPLTLSIGKKLKAQKANSTCDIQSIKHKQKGKKETKHIAHNNHIRKTNSNWNKLFVMRRHDFSTVSRAHHSTKTLWCCWWTGLAGAPRAAEVELIMWSCKVFSSPSWRDNSSSLLQMVTLHGTLQVQSRHTILS